eukprot:jgi/Mesvir1/26957/Mv25916-RA.1
MAPRRAASARRQVVHRQQCLVFAMEIVENHELLCGLAFLRHVTYLRYARKP